MLIEELFSRGIMTMGPSQTDPSRRVGIFNLDFVSSLPALRASELEKFRWIRGEWDYENHVSATRVSPAYSDVGSTRSSPCEKGVWICFVARDGREARQITFDPTRTGDDQFGFINEERSEDGSWAYIDEWRFKRKR